jgi:sterol 3beta-glucosyltransferase
VSREQKGEHPIDLIMAGFTLVGLGLLLSELYTVPVAGLIFQAAAVPSSDPDADPRLFGDVRGRAAIKTMMETFPLQPYALPNLRATYGLPRHRGTWETVFEQAVPMVLPMHSATFSRPADWGAHLALTDFVFLREPRSVFASAPSLAPALDAFITANRAAGRKLVVMTFSSMPVPRCSMLRCAVRMLRECRHPMSLIYIGKRRSDRIDPAVESAAADLTTNGRLLELESTDFGVSING